MCEPLALSFQAPANFIKNARALVGTKIPPWLIVKCIPASFDGEVNVAWCRSHYTACLGVPSAGLMDTMTSSGLAASRRRLPIRKGVGTEVGIFGPLERVSTYHPRDHL